MMMYRAVTRGLKQGRQRPEDRRLRSHVKGSWCVCLNGSYDPEVGPKNESQWWSRDVRIKR